MCSFYVQALSKSGWVRLATGEWVRYDETPMYVRGHQYVDVVVPINLEALDDEQLLACVKINWSSRVRSS